MIDSNEKLARFLPQLSAAPWVALDTEADSLHAYPEKLCLLQVSIPGSDVLIDPLAQLELSPVWPELRRHELIFNAADYDLRLLRRTFGFTPRSIFDTMLAARLLGEREFGLNALLRKFLNVQLEKGSQTANWARRPLTPRMEQYALNDTRYLKPLADILRVRLVETGRLAWHEESCARLIADSSALPPPETDPWRIRGSNKLSRTGLSVLRELWLWREHEALAANRPPYFILAHEALLDIAAAAEDPARLAGLLPRTLSPRRKAELESAVARGLAVPSERRPHPIRFHIPRPTEQEKRRFDDLQKRRDRVAQQLGIDPTLIASRATLGLLARDWNLHAPELMAWQRELLVGNAASSSL